LVDIIKKHTPKKRNKKASFGEHKRNRSNRARKARLLLDANRRRRREKKKKNALPFRSLFPLSPSLFRARNTNTTTTRKSTTIPDRFSSV
tara:strand:- start:53 stop:322 length:270 start_codon:yes stop_codon:yes gene_type:complete